MLPASARAADNFLDGRAQTRQLPDLVMCLLTPNIGLMLAPLGAGQLRRVDYRRAKSLADGSHRMPYRLKESGTSILHEMPAIRHLNGLRCTPCCGLRITACTIARDYRDFRLAGKPCSDRPRLT